MSGRTSRTKGASFERQVARDLQAHGFDEARRGLQYRDGSDAPDVWLRGWNLELKRYRVVRWGDIVKALDQAYASEHSKGRYTAAVMRPDRGRTVVCMDWDEWLEVVKELRKNWDA